MKVAVVGSGVSGLAATWLLNEYSNITVHLYESDSRPGGHANTVIYTAPSSKGTRKSVDVDTGFIVFNPTTYPNFLRFLRMQRTTSELVTPTEMTFSVSRDGGSFEWAGKSLFSVFCQIKNLFDPDMWRLLWDVARFNATARKLLLKPDKDEELSIGDYLARNGYSSSFKNNYLLPMTAAIWSTPAGKCTMDFPARTLLIASTLQIQFLHNHHLLQITGKPSWLTLRGGSKAYVNQILSRLQKSQLHLSTRVTSLTRLSRTSSTPQEPKMLLRTSTGASEDFDHVILACHSDEAIQILRTGDLIEGGRGIAADEERILGAFEWNQNEVVLHADVRLMPKRRLAWSCWNYLTHSRPDNFSTVSLTYGMNDLQHIPEDEYGPVLVTLNAPFEPREDLTVGRWKYDHPILDAKAVRAQKAMPTIQGVDGVSFAGAYLRYGFHEDGFTSGLAAALGVSPSSIHPPFDVVFAEKELVLTTPMMLLATIFEWLERSGLRNALGVLGSLVLGVLRIAFLQF